MKVCIIHNILHLIGPLVSHPRDVLACFFRRRIFAVPSLCNSRVRQKTMLQNDHGTEQALVRCIRNKNGIHINITFVRQWLSNNYPTSPKPTKCRNMIRRPEGFNCQLSIVFNVLKYHAMYKLKRNKKKTSQLRDYTHLPQKHKSTSEDYEMSAFMLGICGSR